MGGSAPPTAAPRALCLPAAAPQALQPVLACPVLPIGLAACSLFLLHRSRLACHSADACPTQHRPTCLLTTRRHDRLQAGGGSAPTDGIAQHPVGHRRRLAGHTQDLERPLAGCQGEQGETRKDGGGVGVLMGDVVLSQPEARDYSSTCASTLASLPPSHPCTHPPAQHKADAVHSQP